MIRIPGAVLGIKNRVVISSLRREVGLDEPLRSKQFEALLENAVDKINGVSVASPLQHDRTDKPSPAGS